MERIPILKMGPFLLITIQVDMHDRLAMALQDDLMGQISKNRARGVLIDISALDVVDSFIGRMLANIAAMARVLDAKTVVTGMRPAVAITLVELGLSLPGVRTALNVERGMELLQANFSEEKKQVEVVRTDELPIRVEDDVVRIRQACREWSIELGFSLVDQTKIVTAASELARNTMVHGGGGQARIEALEDGLRRGLRLTFEDQGKGIPDVAQALKDGYTTGTGLGLGLGGARRLMSEFNVASKAGEGTRIVVARWRS